MFGLVDTNVPRVESDGSSRESHAALDVRRPMCTVRSNGNVGSRGCVSKVRLRSKRRPCDSVSRLQRPLFPCRRCPIGDERNGAALLAIAPASTTFAPGGRRGSRLLTNKPAESREVFSNAAAPTVMARPNRVRRVQVA